MFKNNLKIAIRNLLRNKSLTAINIIGLAAGIATCIIILLFVKSEWSYDRYNAKAAQIVRVVFKGSVKGEMMKEANVMPPVAQTLKADYPEVLDATRLRNYGTPRITYREKNFRDDTFAYVDSNFFQVFTLPFIAGDPKTALLQPNTIVVSADVAVKYFGSEDPIGKELQFKNLDATYTVTGVMENVPASSHFHFDIFGSMASLAEAKENSWMTSNFYTYLVLPKGYDHKQLESKLPNVIDKYLGPQLQQALGMNYAEYKSTGNSLGLFLEPLTDIHLKSDTFDDLSPAGDINTVYIFSVIALFMLLIACINYMNLSTAGASKRSKEVGIRKIMGSMKKQLMAQFLVESVLVTIVALMVALVIVKLTLPTFNQFTGKELALDLTDSRLWFVCLLFGITVGAIAGSYPAFFLSSFKPINVLKAKFTSGKSTVGLRSGLVVFQFFVSVTLLVCTATVYQQLNFVHHKKLGYNKDQVLLIGNTWAIGKNEDVLCRELAADSRVVSVTRSNYLPAGPSNSNNFIVYPDNNETQLVKTLRYEVDDQYIPTLGMELRSGRNFSKEYGTDSSAVIINETAARAFGWKEIAPNSTITRSDNQGNKQTFTVIGVVKDFHFKSLHQPISPLVMTLGNNSGTIIAKIKTTDVSGLLASIKKQWSGFTSEEPFVYAFLDERFNETYLKEQKTGTILGIFAGLTIFVACLGLFGLATFMAEQRTKEIGIRKVLGASVPSVVALLSKDFLKLVFIAFSIAMPVAWFIMNRWLQDFAYRIHISLWIFIGAAVLVVLIAALSVGFKAVKAALSNPVNSLRNE